MTIKTAVPRRVAKDMAQFGLVNLKHLDELKLRIERSKNREQDLYFQTTPILLIREKPLLKRRGFILNQLKKVKNRLKSSLI